MHPNLVIQTNMSEIPEVKATLTYRDKGDAVRALRVDNYLDFISNLNSALRNAIKYQLSEGDKEFQTFVRLELLPFLREEQLECGKLDLEGNLMYGDFQKIIEDIGSEEATPGLTIPKSRQALVKNAVWFTFEYMRNFVNRAYMESTGEQIENIWND